MSEPYNPYSTIFEMQRESIEQTRELLHWSAEVGKQSNRMVKDGIEANRSVQTKGSEVAKTVMRTSLESTAAAMPGSDAMMQNIETTVDDQFDAIDEINAQYWDAIAEILDENSQAVEDATEQYLELIDESLDTTLEAIASYETDLTQDRVKAAE